MFQAFHYQEPRVEAPPDVSCQSQHRIHTSKNSTDSSPVTALRGYVGTRHCNTYDYLPRSDVGVRLLAAVTHPSICAVIVRSNCICRFLDIGSWAGPRSITAGKLLWLIGCYSILYACNRNGRLASLGIPIQIIAQRGWVLIKYGEGADHTPIHGIVLLWEIRCGHRLCY